MLFFTLHVCKYYVSKNSLQCALCFLTMQCRPMSPHMVLIVCLFVCFWGLLSHTRIFHLYRDVTITGEGLRIWAYARHQ